MSPVTRTLGRTVLPGTVLRDIALTCLAVAFTGLSYGAVAVASGFPLWVPAAQSVFVLAGASEFLFIGIVAAGGNPIAAALAGLLVNGRHLPYGLALPDITGPPGGTGRGWRRILGTHLMNDETVVFTLSQPDYPRQRAAYWTCGLGMLISWSGGALLGALVGSAIHDTSAFGLDAMFPAVILALIIPSLRAARAPAAKAPAAKPHAAKTPAAKTPAAKTLRSAAAGGAVIALTATPFVPAGLPILLALPAALLLLRDRAAPADPS